jgi:hypothetical protein
MQQVHSAIKIGCLLGVDFPWHYPANSSLVFMLASNENHPSASSSLGHHPCMLESALELGPRKKA